MSAANEHLSCPSDHALSAVQSAAGWTARIRSYSMNAMVGDAGAFSTNGININNPDYMQFFKITQIPHPSEIFVFLDEHPDSIDDGYFLESRLLSMAVARFAGLVSQRCRRIFLCRRPRSLHRWLKPNTIRPPVAGRRQSSHFTSRTPR